MGVLSTLWRDQFAHRLDWADRAYADFLKNIDPELTRYFAGHGKEVYIVLYGKTQVGKTSLLLKLMGVNHDVSKVLRGGRGKGKSATATVTRYTASPDDLWRLTSDANSDDKLDDAGIEKELQQLRQRVESGVFFLESPVIVKIPRKYFHAEQKQSLKVNILDLPGESARNEGEAKHVRIVAQKYVPAADLILLVGLGDDLSFLKPEALPIPEIGDWRYQPEKFRIITTYSTRAKSFVDFLKNVAQPTKELFRERLFEQIDSHGIKLPDDAWPKYFYPLEFGDSWLELQVNDPVLFDKVSSVIDGADGLFDELHLDIKGSATKYGRIMAAIKTHDIAEKHMTRSLAKCDLIVEELRESMGAALEKKETFSAQCKLLERKIDELKSAAQCQQKAKDDAKQATGTICSEGIHNSVNKNRQDLYSYLTWRHEDILKSFDSFVNDITELSIEIPRGSISQRIDTYLSPVRSDLRSRHSWDSYPGNWLTGNFEKDLGECRDAVKNAVQAVRALCCNLLDEEGDAIAKTLKGQIAAINAQTAGYRESQEHFQKSFTLDEQNIEKLLADRAEFVERMSYSIQLGNEFKAKITESFHVEIRNRKKDMAAESIPAKRFMKLVSLVQVFNEKNKLFANCCA